MDKNELKTLLECCGLNNQQIAIMMASSDVIETISKHKDEAKKTDEIEKILNKPENIDNQNLILRTVKEILGKQFQSIDYCNKCYKCKHRRNIPGDAHSACVNGYAYTIGDEHGYKNGWFFWPYNFDPTWLRYCDGFEGKEEG